MTAIIPQSRRRLFKSSAVAALAFKATAAAADDAPTGAGHSAIDEMMVSFMKTHDATGASVAVARQGRLVHARGYGQASKQPDDKVLPNSLFRIASVSKPITAVATLRLCQEQKLSLDARLTDVLGISAKDERFSAITVEHLLQHSAGFDRDASFDPMFRDEQIAETQMASLPTSKQMIVDYMLDRPLDFDPGSRYAYSNFGYLLLGLIIEKASGRPYDDYVRTALMKPQGIRGVLLGRTDRSLAADGEVTYTGDTEKRFRSVLTVGRPLVSGPYGKFHLEPMASHGGWLATSVQLVRFGCALAGLTSKPMLQPRSIRKMLAAPSFHDASDPVHYGCGVQVRELGGGKRNAWHSGSLNGTSTIWVIRHDRFVWAVLFNKRNASNGNALASLIDPEMHRAINSVASWPRHDLFKRFLADQ
jgi:N-acyl-D-amino-acid deacylase